MPLAKKYHKIWSLLAKEGRLLFLGFQNIENTYFNAIYLSFHPNVSCSFHLKLFLYGSLE